ncbi:PREDICTED: long-chain-fatty-acid--CoA ligase ACSBG1, partial [Condylura cristata]|uniref:long-chain-fatty-acid--CoA ligase ACSBG1 n=1 Tax=Condylura cristata TaxID=143302 RepID=UPI0006439564
LRLELGLERAHSVAILGFNSPEWFYSAVGTVFAGGIVTGIYTTSSPEACRHIAHDCRANILVVDSQRQLEKILKVGAPRPPPTLTGKGLRRPRGRAGQGRPSRVLGRQTAARGRPAGAGGRPADWGGAGYPADSGMGAGAGGATPWPP